MHEFVCICLASCVSTVHPVCLTALPLLFLQALACMQSMWTECHHASPFFLKVEAQSDESGDSPRAAVTAGWVPVHHALCESAHLLHEEEISFGQTRIGASCRATL